MAQAVQTTQARLTAAEYSRLPETNLPMELIDGEIVMAPAPIYDHQKTVYELAKQVEEARPNGTTCISPMDVYLDKHNVVQPDVFWVSSPESACKLGEDRYWHGPPDLVIEVLSPGSARQDRGKKFQLYEKQGVSELWLADPDGKYIEVWRRSGDQLARVGVFGPEEEIVSPLFGKRAVKLAAVFA